MTLPGLLTSMPYSTLIKGSTDLFITITRSLLALLKLLYIKIGSVFYFNLSVIFITFMIICFSDKFVFELKEEDWNYLISFFQISYLKFVLTHHLAWAIIAICLLIGTIFSCFRLSQVSFKSILAFLTSVPTLLMMNCV